MPSPSRTSKQPIKQPPDIASLYPEIRALAAQCQYPLSFLHKSAKSLTAYRSAARKKILELFHYSPPPIDPRPRVVARWETDHYIQEKIVFSTTPWFRVPAYVLIPKGKTGPRPAIIDLHSHGGMFLYGKEKVMPQPGREDTTLTHYRQANYRGKSTSLELCLRGYVVISIDAFYFGERCSLTAADVRQFPTQRGKYSPKQVQAFNERASLRESVLAKSLFWAGATWQGVAHWDDIRTLDYLITRPEVDPKRIGCLGISMGGDRAAYLAGLDPRITCAVVAGWMSTLTPMLANHVQTHSFMHFLPGMTRYLDLPDLVGCMAPKPLMVLQASRDGLYPLKGMREGVAKLRAIYKKAHAPSRFVGRFYDEPHTFSEQMQHDAYTWLDRWLKP